MKIIIGARYKYEGGRGFVRIPFAVTEDYVHYLLIIPIEELELASHSIIISSCPTSIWGDQRLIAECVK